MKGHAHISLHLVQELLLEINCASLICHSPELLMQMPHSTFQLE